MNCALLVALPRQRNYERISSAVSRPWYGEPNAVSNAVDYAKFFSQSHDAVIRVYDDAGNLIEAISKSSNECDSVTVDLRLFACRSDCDG